MPNDPEHGKIQVRYVKGYPSLAAFIASDPDKSSSIYRRFDRLSARNLLYLQSELAELEARQDRLDEEDRKRTTAEKESACNWQVFKERAKCNPHEQERMEVVMQVRDKLKEYREAILLESTLLSLEPPSKRVLAAFRNSFHNAGSEKDTFPTLGGESATILDNKYDLMALKKATNEDRLTSFLRHYFAIFFVTRTTNRPLAYTSERRLNIVVATINVIIAAGLLFGAIYNLYHVRDEGKRLALIAGYTTAFAICVGLITNARRSEVFAACAAYAAVLVVFVSGNLGNTRAAAGAA